MAEKSNFRLSSGILSFVQTRFIPQKSVLPCFEKNENKSRQNFAIFLKEKSLASTTPRFDHRPEKKNNITRIKHGLNILNILHSQPIQYQEKRSTHDFAGESRPKYSEMPSNASTKMAEFTHLENELKIQNFRFAFIQRIQGILSISESCPLHFKPRLRLNFSRC